MERIKINLPEVFAFSTLLTIRITDLNYGAHVGNDTFLSLIQEARQQFLMHYGYKELDVGGYGVILADAAVEYKKELSYGDKIKISVAASGLDKYGFDLYYKVEIVTHSGLTLAGKAKTGMFCYDYEKKKLVPIPEEARWKLTGQKSKI
ncbi:MAG TPA: thioesterase family protein [Chitinophagaceae bacterium]